MKYLPAAGFTLIELLVVAAIMMVVIGGSIAGYVQFNEYRTLVTEGRTLENRIKMAQNKARIRATKLCDDDPDVVNDDFQGFRTTISATGEVNTHELCGATASPSNTQMGPITDSFTPTMIFAGGSTQYDFFTPQSQHDPEIGAGSISLSSTKNRYTITISSTGVISSAITDL
ncbi:MAG: prepilin-type N-terminal cleavage/methylation domain-containing protein [bacterium]|nr:prepilin-type N-terminal cleavage/methylation domain-containing protein [bacterium]